MTFAEQIRYDRPFQKVIQYLAQSEIEYINIFQNANALKISVGNSYSGDKLMHNLDNLQKGGKYYAQIASHQSELRIEENVFIKNHYLYLTCKLIT